MWFIVERYTPGVGAAEIRKATTRLAESTAELAARGVQVRYLGSSFITREESCFCRFQSSSVEAVRAACDHASFRYDRILQTEEIFGPIIGRDHENPTS